MKGKNILKRMLPICAGTAVAVICANSGLLSASSIGLGFRSFGAELVKKVLIELTDSTYARVAQLASLMLVGTVIFARVFSREQGNAKSKL